MKRTLSYSFILFILTLLSGCFIGEYKPLLKYHAPFGAHYVKPGMTREERLRDLAACGTQCGLSVCFNKEQVEKATIPKDKALPGEITDGHLILLRQLRACMASKGYHGVQKTCEGNDPKVLEPCMYP